MPNRIIHEKALLSHTMGQLSDGAERLFWRLTVVADDHGRFDAHPVTVKAKCFPTLVDSLKTSKVCAWLTELSIDHCIFYQVAGRAYGQFRKWSEYQRTYNQKSKFPEPPASSGESPGNPALILNRESIYENRESRIGMGETPPSPSSLVSREQKLAELDALTITPALQQWAMEEHGVTIPAYVLEEFKDRWRDEKKLRSNWSATFKNRVSQLVGWGQLKPAKRDAFQEFVQGAEA